MELHQLGLNLDPSADGLNFLENIEDLQLGTDRVSQLDSHLMSEMQRLQLGNAGQMTGGMSTFFAPMPNAIMEEYIQNPSDMTADGMGNDMEEMVDDSVLLGDLVEGRGSLGMLANGTPATPATPAVRDTVRNK